LGKPRGIEFADTDHGMGRAIIRIAFYYTWAGLGVKQRPILITQRLF